MGLDRGGVKDSRALASLGHMAGAGEQVGGADRLRPGSTLTPT